MIDLEQQTEELLVQEGRRSRARRNKQKEKLPEFNRDFKRQLPRTEIWPACIWSLILSVLSVANPIFTGFSNNLQSQNLYAGMAMLAGQEPYEHFFGTNGVLYYLLVAFGSLFNTTLIFACFQCIALFISGIYLYKISVYFSKSSQVARNITSWFYLFLLTIDLGGGYASLFALPFVLTSIWFLIRYFENAVKDESFILYGIDAALVFMIYPKSVILWLVAPLVLFFYNGRNHQLARGIYQLLATIFGFLLVVYSVGYYTFVQQILGTAIQQTFLYNISLDFSYKDFLWTLTIVMLFFLISGFLKNIFQTLTSIVQGKHTYIKVVVLLTVVLQTVFIIGNPNFEWSQLTILFPYGFVMATMSLPIKQEDWLDKDNTWDRIQEYSYLKSSLYLPSLLFVLLVFLPLQSYLFQDDIRVDRQVIAHYIKENTSSTDVIYAWDNNAQIYLQSKRLSSASITTAHPFLNTEDNKTSLIYDLNKNKARYIAVNKGFPLLESIDSNIQKNYTKLDMKLERFDLYERKE